MKPHIASKEYDGYKQRCLVHLVINKRGYKFYFPLSDPQAIAVQLPSGSLFALVDKNSDNVAYCANFQRKIHYQFA